MNNILVTAAIVKEQNKFLLAQRLPGGHNGGKWEFPGGKVEPGEDPEVGLIREIQEELDMVIEVLDIAAVISVKHDLPDQESSNIILLYYFCQRKAGFPKSIGCQNFLWTTLTDILKFDLAPADRIMADKLVKKFCN